MMTDISDTEVYEILSQYHGLVESIARSAFYSSASIEFADLCQIGDVAVLRAIKTYDPTCGTTIKSYVARVVRQDIFREAARFLGVFTVDHRVTSLAAKASRLHAKGKSDEQISAILSESSQRKFDADHVRDLRLAYGRRQHQELEFDDLLDEEDSATENIRSLLRNVICGPTEEIILQQRLLQNEPAGAVANSIGLTQSQLYRLEGEIRERIRKAIEGVTE